MHRSFRPVYSCTPGFTTVFEFTLVYDMESAASLQSDIICYVSFLNEDYSDVHFTQIDRWTTRFLLRTLKRPNASALLHSGKRWDVRHHTFLNADLALTCVQLLHSDFGGSV